MNKYIKHTTRSKRDFIYDIDDSAFNYILNIYQNRNVLIHERIIKYLNNGILIRKKYKYDI